MDKMLNSTSVIQNALKKFNKELMEKVDSLEIDTEVAFQAYYVFIGDNKYSLRILKSTTEYKWDVTIEDDAVRYYHALMDIDVHTGKAKVLHVYLNNLHRLHISK